MSKKFNIIFIFSILVNSIHSSNHMSSILCDPENRAKFAGFFDEVLRVITAKDFYSFIDSNFKDVDLVDAKDDEFYELISSRISAVEPTLSMLYKLGSLAHQKGVLAGQIKLLVDRKEINGCVEIGTPCTYISAISSSYNINGPVYAINEKQGSLDFVQSFTPKLSSNLCFYDKFVPLNNYEPIPESSIPSNSVDLVVCVIGLHHIPEPKIDAFIASINRILRPGGLFILRDHDASTQELKTIAYVAHGVYNAIIPHEPLNAELAEIRNFQSLDYWIQRVESQGFNSASAKYLQENDPTLNTMVKFVKNKASASTSEAISAEIASGLSNYKRDAEKTYLGAPEWFNVDASRDYADFIIHTPFYQYPYFANIKTYWDIFGKSWQAAAKKNGHLKVLCSEYTQMNLFVGIAMTLEYSFKGLISWPVRMAFTGSEPMSIKAFVSDPLNQVDTLGDFIKVETVNSGIKLVSISRYKEFLRAMRAMSGTDISILEIAGNKEIHVKARSASGVIFPNIDGCSLEYTWQLPTMPEYTYYALTVNVEKLVGVIKAIEEVDSFEVLHVHDF